MATQNFVVSQNISAGPHVYPNLAGVSVPGGLSLCEMFIDTSACDPSTFIVLSVWVSLDGTNWIFAGGITTNGGPHTGKGGIAVNPNCIIQISQMPTYPQKARITIDLNQAAILTIGMTVS